MAAKFKRHIILNVNKYQSRLIFPVLMVCLLACNLSLISLSYFCFPLDSKIFFGLQIKQLAFYVPWFLLAICVMLVYIALRAYQISNKIVGPYTRIIKELDDIVATKSNRELWVRDGDDMFAELIKRINELIKRTP